MAKISTGIDHPARMGQKSPIGPRAGSNQGHQSGSRMGDREGILSRPHT